MFDKVLIANRGEIALRIHRACREMGIQTVAVHSTADSDAMHVRLADESVCIGPPPARDSYLNIPAILSAATIAGADAIHPGYGFLSENAEFAAAVQQAGLIWIGPPVAAVQAMGSKIEAKKMMAAAGVPVLDELDPDTVTAEQLPVLIKASAGGGGRGMRVVRDLAELPGQVEAAQREAQSAFGDAEVFCERYLATGHHVEVQVMADAHGTVWAVGERECSIQRRHQKIIEEAPSPLVERTPGMRAKLFDAARLAAEAIGYTGAGTVEFMADDEGDFFFLEMNTRLQVEHPVTEAVAGVDLVHAQFIVAAGGRVPWTQAALTQRGHAIECRIYAEDPAAGFLPQAGKLLVYREPAGPGLRIDSGVAEGGTIPVHYDPLLAKLTASAETRDAAIARARAALHAYPILGIRTNVPFLIRVLEHPEFRAGRLHTRFVDDHATDLQVTAAPPLEAVAAAAVLPGESPVSHGPARSSGVDPWETIRGWGR